MCGYTAVPDADVQCHAPVNSPRLATTAHCVIRQRSFAWIVVATVWQYSADTGDAVNIMYTRIRFQTRHHNKVTKGRASRHPLRKFVCLQSETLYGNTWGWFHISYNVSCDRARQFAVYGTANWRELMYDLSSQPNVWNNLAPTLNSLILTIHFDEHSWPNF